MPLAHNTYNLGTDAIKWKTFIPTAFTGNLVGNVSGTVPVEQGLQINHRNPASN